MFYNYLIFSMVALSLRIFKKYIVSLGRNCLFQALKPIVSRHETLCFAICSKKAMSRNQRFLLENHSLNSATRALLTSIFSLIPE